MRLSFRPSFRSTEMNLAELPVEVRTQTSSLVARTVSSASLEVDPGVYYVTVQLPGGQEIIREADLREGDQSLVLEPDLEDRWDHEWDEERHFLRGKSEPEPSSRRKPVVRAAKAADWDDSGASDVAVQNVGDEDDFDGQDEVDAEYDARALGSGPLETVVSAATLPATLAPVLGRPPRGLMLRCFVGNQLAPTSFHAVPSQSLLLPQMAELGRVAYFALPQDLAGMAAVVQLLQVGKRPLNVVVPAGARFSVYRRPGKTLPGDVTYRLDVLMRSPQANLQLNYARRGSFRRAGMATEAEKLLQQKIDDPLSAAVGAYSLLRIGETERLHDWTEHLFALFPALPDGAAIFAEHLARIGKHREAAATFGQLLTRGLPVFADGLSYAFQRLTVYASLKPERSQGIDLPLVMRTLAAITPFAAFLRAQQPLCIFPGADPLKPSSELWSGEAPLAGACAVPQLERTRAAASIVSPPSAASAAPAG